MVQDNLRSVQMHHILTPFIADERFRTRQNHPEREISKILSERKNPSLVLESVTIPNHHFRECFVHNDLGVLEARDRSGMSNESILAGLECHRTIGAVQTRIPEIVNRDSQNFLYSFSFGELD